MGGLISERAALDLLKKYNESEYLIYHGLTVSGVMKWFAVDLGFGGEVDYWGIAGLLHDIDFEMYPQEHCKKAPELLKAAGVDDGIIRAVCSHGYGLTVDVEPVSQMEKVLFAVDELTGLIGAAARMRPSGSVTDMELSSLKKKYKDRKFAAGCSRDVIEKGARMLGWELDTLLSKTILAMRSCEQAVKERLRQ
ncbi:MAG: hydrolase [Clostridiales bacterium]|jgi:predicted hydrolase (HD superfamily)|nr:hydrolase [Clostridiales bacterium]